MQPKFISLIGYKEFYSLTYEGDPLNLLKGLKINQAIISLSNLFNKFLNPTVLNQEKILNYDTQIEFINFFIEGTTRLSRRFHEIANSGIYSNKNPPVLFSRYSILYTIELLKKNQPLGEVYDVVSINREQAEGLFKLLLNSNNIVVNELEGEQKEEGNEDFIKNLAPRVLIINEINNRQNPLVTMAISIAFFNYFSNHLNLAGHFSHYINQTYQLEVKDFWKTVNVLYSTQINDWDYRKALIPKGDSQMRLFKSLSNHKKLDTDTKILLNIRKYPLFEFTENQFKIIDVDLLLDKLFFQLINDFWFDYIKIHKVVKANNYFGEVGRFIEKRLISIALKKLARPGVNIFHGSDLSYNNYEICDLVIQVGRKVILIEIKGGLFTEDQKFSGELGSLIGENIEDFKKKFGLKQLEKDLPLKLKYLENIIPEINRKRHQIFRIAVNLEKAFGTPLMPIFINKFIDQNKETINKSVFYPIKLTTLYEFERLLIISKEEPWSFFANIISSFCCQKPSIKKLEFVKPLNSFLVNPKKHPLNQMYLEEFIKPYLKS